jgi:phosphodiesterase/alkaline phosphatase D-like protein
MKRTSLFAMTLLAAATMIQPLAAQKTAPKAAEQIVDGPRVEGTGDTWAVIAWTTNTGGSSVVNYGIDRNSLSQTAQAPYANSDKLKTGHEVHRVHLKNLKPGTTYYFSVSSAHGEGTGTQAKSGVQEFTTKSAGQGGSAKGGDADSNKHEALKIVNGPRVEGTGATWAMIAWTTNTGGSSVIKYGTDRNSLGQTAQAPYADSDKLKTGHEVHRVKVQGLKPNTKYYYQIDSGHGEGTGTEAKSSVEEFTTKAK